MRTSVTIIVVMRDGKHYWFHHRDIETAKDLEIAIQEIRRDYPDNLVQHKTLIHGTRTPIVMYPGRGSNELQALYGELR